MNLKVSLIKLTLVNLRMLQFNQMNLQDIYKSGHRSSQAVVSFFLTPWWREYKRL